MKADKTVPWRTSLLLSGSLILTVGMGLLLAAVDSLQTRSILPPVQLPIVNVAATALAAAHIVPITNPTATPQPTMPPNEASDPASPDSGEAGSIIDSCDNAPPDWADYIVQQRDTLAALSLQSRVSEQAIAQANCLDFNQLIPGLIIQLPTQPPTAVACGPPSWWVRYTVRQGDTLFQIARQRGTTLHNLMNANCLISSYLVSGRSLYVPPGVIAPTRRPSSTPFPSITPTELPPTSSPTVVVPTATPALPTTLPPTESPAPTNTTPTSTATATATATATPTLSPPDQTVTAVAPTPTIVATDTPFPPTATNTPVPSSTASPAPTNTPEPTSTVLSTPTSTPIPSSTAPPTSTNTPEPTAVPPTATTPPQVGVRRSFVMFPTWRHFGLCYNLRLISHNSKTNRCTATD